MKLSVEFLYTEDDWIQFQLYYIKHAKSQKRRMVFFQIFVPIVWMLTAFLLSFITEIHDIIWLITFGIISLLWIPFCPKIIFWSLKRNVRKMLKDGRMDNIFGMYTFTLEEDGLLSVSASGSTKTLYSAIQKIEFCEGYAYLFTSPVSAHVIPDSAFTAEITKEMFIGELKSKISATEHI